MEKAIDINNLYKRNTIFISHFSDKPALFVTVVMKSCAFSCFQKVDHLSGPCYQLVEYPAPGFVFQLPENRSIVDLAR
jgi:hypothetical protein